MNAIVNFLFYQEIQRIIYQFFYCGLLARCGLDLSGVGHATGCGYGHTPHMARFGFFNAALVGAAYHF